MRISVFPKGELDAICVERTMTVFDWIEQARQLSVDGLELYSGMFTSTDRDFVERVGEHLTDAGFAMPMLCASPDLSHPDSSVRAGEIDREIAMMEITATLGGRGASTRVLSGQRHPGVEIGQGVEWVVGAIEQLLPVAAELGVTLAMENHYKDGFWTHPEFAQDAVTFQAIVEAIPDRTHFGVQFDPSNAIVAGDDPVWLLERVIDRVVTMQASDRSLAPGATLDDLRGADGTIGYSPALQHGVIGQGLNDYPRIFSTLVESGYDGWISIEDGVNGMGDLSASVEFLREARERWFGGSSAVRVATHEAALAAAGLPSIARPQLEEEAAR